MRPGSSFGSEKSVAKLGVIHYIFFRTLITDYYGGCMQRHGFLFVGFIIGFLVLSSECGENDPVVARIGKNRIITINELKMDFEKNNSLPSGSKPGLLDYQKHLYKMVQEQIKVIAAYRLGLDKDSTVLAVVEPEEQRLLLRRLYEKIILEPTVRETDIRNYYTKTGKEVLVRKILFKFQPPLSQIQEDSIKTIAMNIYKRIQKGESFSELARQYSGDENSAINGGILGYVQYTRGNDPVLDAAFTMRSGEVSKPIKNTLGFNIIRVEEIRSKTRKPFDKAHDEIQSRLIRERNAETSKLAKAYEDRQKKIVGFTWVDSSVDTLATFFKNAKPFYREELVDTLHKLPADIQSMTLVKYDNRGLKVRDLAKMLERINSIMGIPMRNKETIKSYIDQFATSDILSKVAIRQGLQKDKKVKNFLNNSREKAMVELLLKKYINQVNEPKMEEVLSFYESHKDSLYSKPEMVRIQEVMVNDLALAERIKNLTIKRKDLARYPAQYTIRPGMKEKNGIFEPITRLQYNQISEVAFGLKIGETGGPIKLQNNTYSIFKVLAKSEKEVRPFEKIKKRVERDLIKIRQKEKEQAWLEAQEKEMKIQIEKSVLEKDLHVQ
jgi:parvulin-like peptidyl-prolyl isomerase